MLNILSKIPFYKSFYAFGFPKMLPINYTISLTYSCNSKCQTCRIYKRKANELKLLEYKKIFLSLKKSPYWVTFSGGEPFLRKDINEIVKSFYDICEPKIINIPTNGILTTQILHHVKEICEHCKKAQIIINLSLDGVEEQHDRIRNFTDGYKKAINTYNELKALEFTNLSVGIHTVVSKFNINHFSAIANHLMNLNPDQYITEIAEERNELQTMGMDFTPDIVHYRAVADFLIHRIKNTRTEKRINRIAQAFRIEYYNLVKTLLRDKKQVIPCYAGITSCQISPDGDVWVCCIKATSLGNLRDNKYSFSKIWFNRFMNNEREEIKIQKCFCPMANVAYTNMLMDIKTLFRVACKNLIFKVTNKINSSG